MSGRHRRVHGIATLLFLVAATLSPCTPSVNRGFAGNFFPDVFITDRPLPGWTVRFEPAGELMVSNIRYDAQGFLHFSLQVSPTAPAGFYASFCEFMGQEPITNSTAFEVLATETPTPTTTPIPPTPTSTPIPPTATPPAPTATHTPTQTPPGPTPTPTRTPPGPTPTPTGTPAGPTPTPTRTPPGPMPTPTHVPGGLRIAPNSIASGSRSIRLLIAGANFTSQTRVTTPADVLLERVTPLSPARLEIVVSTAPDTPSGPRVIGVDTPGGPPGTVLITVIPPESLSAPVSVTTASIVHPRPGSFLMLGDQLFAKGLLATTGTGPVIGVWTFDGVPFDRFDVHAAGGDPIPIEAKVSIPISTEGDHTLQLVLESPQLVLSGAVRLVVVPRVASRLRLIGPPDGAAVDAPPLFRWTLVPGAQAHELVFGPERQLEENAPSIRVVGGSARLTEGELRKVSGIPSLADIPVLRFFWSVRPVHPVNVRGKAPPARELMIFVKPRIVTPLEGSASALPDGAKIRWKPIGRGVLYRVAFFEAGAPPRPVFSALTHRGEYRLRRELLPPGTDRLLFQVEAIGPHGAPLGESRLRPLALPRARPEARAVPAALGASLMSVAPSGTESRPGRHPKIIATWEGRISPERIALLIDRVDVTPVSRLAEGAIAYEALLPLTEGLHNAVIRLGDVETAWSFRTREPPRGPPPTEAAVPAAGSEPTGDWKVDVSGLLSVISGSEANERDTVHATLSSSSSFLGGTWSLEETADLAAHHELDAPRTTVQDSRNWLLRAGGGKERWRADGIVGYAAPESADGLQILSTGFTRGGVEVKLTTPGGRISGYQTFDDKLGGIFSSTLGEEQRIRFGAWEAPLPSDRFLLRAVYLDVRDDGDPLELLSPTRARAYGAIGRWTISPAFAVTVEGARSKLEPADDPGRNGNSFRLNLAGIVGATRWLVNLFRTDGGFLNPANPSLTSFVQPDRTGGDFGLSRLFGRLTAGIGYRYVESGAAEGSRVPDARDHSATLNFSMPFSPRVLATANGTWALSRADAGAGATGPVPETDRAQYGGQFSLTETLGRLVLSQRLSWNKLADDVSPDNDVTTQSAQLTANGNVLSTLLLVSSLALTRNETPLGGRNDQLVAMFQPTWSLTPIRVTLAPRATYSRSKNGITGRAPRAEHYQALVYWTPLKAGRFEGTLGLSSEWIRTVSGAPGPRPSFDRRYIGTFAIRWGTGIPAPAHSIPAALEYRPFRPTPGVVADRVGSGAGPGAAGPGGF